MIIQQTNQEYLNELMKAPRCLAPRGWTARQVMSTLKKDPYQTRTSLHPIILRHSRTGKSGVISEFVENFSGEDRIAVETTDAIVFIARVTNSMMGSVFIPIAAITHSDNLDKKSPPYIIRG